MRFVVLDVGNTTAKALILDEDLVPEMAWRVPLAWLGDLLVELPPGGIRGASTVVAGLRELLLSAGFRLLGPRNFGLPLAYAETVGPDRLAAAWFVRRWVGEPSVVVDAGSAVTVDAIGPRGEFLGGVIVPGPERLLSAARTLDFARRLPLDSGELSPIAHDTPSAVRSGILLVLGHGIRGLIGEQARALGWDSHRILLTGGAAVQLAPHLPGAAYEPFLVAMGVGAWLVGT